MKEVQDKVENYLRKQFPGKSLIKFSRIDKNFETYGFMGIEIKVVENGKEIFYQIIKRK